MFIQMSLTMTSTQPVETSDNQISSNKAMFAGKYNEQSLLCNLNNIISEQANNSHTFVFSSSVSRVTGTNAWNSDPHLTTKKDCLHF